MEASAGALLGASRYVYTYLGKGERGRADMASKSYAGRFHCVLSLRLVALLLCGACWVGCMECKVNFTTNLLPVIFLSPWTASTLTLHLTILNRETGLSCFNEWFIGAVFQVCTHTCSAHPNSLSFRLGESQGIDFKKFGRRTISFFHTLSLKVNLENGSVLILH